MDIWWQALPGDGRAAAGTFPKEYLDPDTRLLPEYEIPTHEERVCVLPLPESVGEDIPVPSVWGIPFLMPFALILPCLDDTSCTVSPWNCKPIKSPYKFSSLRYLFIVVCDYSPKMEEKGLPTNSFYETSFIMIPKPGKDTKKQHFSFQRKKTSGQYVLWTSMQKSSKIY